MSAALHTSMLSSLPLLARGKVQTAEGVTHLVVDHLEDWTPMLGQLTPDSAPGSAHAPARGRHPRDVQVLPGAQYPTLQAAMHAYLDGLNQGRPLAAAIAIANPITGDEVRMTNHHWVFLQSAVKAARFEGGVGEIVELLAPAGLSHGRLLLVGTGPADKIDAGLIFGAGYPPFRGGPLQAARDRGVTL